METLADEHGTSTPREKMLAGLKTIHSSEESARLNRLRVEKLAAARESARHNAGVARSGRISHAEWRAMFTVKAFGAHADAALWAQFYDEMRLDLRAQYHVTKRKNGQYRLLVDQAAALATLCAIHDAEHDWSEVTNKHRDQLRGFIAQLQRYTESEKHQVIVRNEALEEAMRVVVGIAEATISPGERETFLRALTAAITGEDVPTIAPRRQLAGPADAPADRNADADVIDGVSHELEPAVPPSNDIPSA